MLSEMRDYQNLESEDVRMIGNQTADGIESQLLVIQTPFGYRRMAELFRPDRAGTFPAILYVHWYEPDASDSNRSQFVEEAKEMARSGAIEYNLDVDMNINASTFLRAYSRQFRVPTRLLCRT